MAESSSPSDITTILTLLSEQQENRKILGRPLRNNTAHGEILRSFVARFNKEKVSITNYNLDTAISAFQKRLRHDSDLYKELTKYPCKMMEDVLAKA